MICPKSSVLRPPDDHPVTAALRELAADEITLELVPPDQEAGWNKLVRKHHYLKEDRMVGESLRYVAKQNGKRVGLVGWCSAAYHIDARDRTIGWTDLQRKARRHWVVCNARFVLLPAKSTAPNLASRILRQNLERLSQDWMECYQHPVLLAETFVDPERFEGTCYRACNWIEIGVTKGFGRSRLEFYQLHAQPKAIFLYPLHPQAMVLLSAPVLPADWAAHEHRDDPHRYPLSTAQTHSLLKALGALRDPRRYRGRLHRKVATIVALAIAAMVAGNNSFSAIGQFVQGLNQTQLRSLGASRCRQSGQWLAPSESTLRRVLQRLDPLPLDRVLNDWLASHLKDTSIIALAADGKCARTASKIKGQSIQLFSALDVQSRIVRGQIQIPSKTNEIPMLKDLLAELDLRGTLISLDAIHTQTGTAAFVKEQKQADYLFPVKANQPKLFQKLARLSKAQTGVFFPPHLTLDQGHGRHETRQLYVFEVTEQQTGFPHAAQAAIRINTTHHLKSVRVSEEIEILLTSRSSTQMSPAELESFRRGHWGIENPLHYVRDVSFGEDLSTIRTDQAPQNMAALRNLVIGLCALDGARRGKRASFLPAFRRRAQNDKQVALDLVARPLLDGS